MKQITEDYVSYEIAVLLKEKGFKQDCDYATSWYAAEYYKNSARGEWFEGEHQIIEDIDDKCAISYLSDEGIFIPAPTHQMALKWLREVHNIVIEINLEDYMTTENGELQVWYSYTIWTFIRHLGETGLTDSRYDDRAFWQENVKVGQSYEEAVEAAIDYVLKNLI